MAMALEQTFFGQERNLRIAHRREVVPNVAVELLCCAAHGQDVSAEAGNAEL